MKKLGEIGDILTYSLLIVDILGLIIFFFRLVNLDHKFTVR